MLAPDARGDDDIAARGSTSNTELPAPTRLQRESEHETMRYGDWPSQLALVTKFASESPAWRSPLSALIDAPD